MALRRPRLVVTVNGELDITLLDSGDIIFDWLTGEVPDESKELDRALLEIEEALNRTANYMNKLSLLRDLINAQKRNAQLEFEIPEEYVKRVYNSKPAFKSGICEDCDQERSLIRSQWSTKIAAESGGDLVCCTCETLREFEYGLPPEEFDE